MHRITKGHLEARWWRVVVSVLVAAMSMAIVWNLWFSSFINRAAFKRIQLGMTVDEVTAVLGVPPGYYNVSPTETFVLQEHQGMISFGDGGYEEIETVTAIYDIVSRKTGTPVARLRKWANDENEILVITEGDQVVGKMHCVSTTAFNRRSWLTQLGRRFGW